MKIFILDDDKIHNDLSILTFQLLGENDVDFRTSGIEALQYLDECKKTKRFPDLMMVDLNMPGMNGFTFIQQFESNYLRFCPKCRIVMLTNSILDDERYEALNYKSVLDFWSKPLNQKRLKQLISDIKPTYSHHND